MIERRRFLALAPGVALAASAASAGAQETRNTGRDAAVAIIAAGRKIVSPHGVERLEAVKIGGIDQWVSIRGADRRNPVLLFIHGGPGYVSIPMSWWFARGWEDHFTVVQWDQRGAGKTYLLNDPAVIGPTLTLDRMVADSSEMIDWVCGELGQSKIFVLGHSWGSYLGLQMARRRPERLHAYIGVGQLTDGPESERRGWAFAMDVARRAGNAEAVRQLEAVAPYFPVGGAGDLKSIYAQRKWLAAFGGLMAYRDNADVVDGLVKLSPDYSDSEIARIWDGNDFSEARLLVQALGLDQSGVRKLDCPLVLFAGRHDFTVNSQVAAEWFSKVSAPTKSLVWFEDSGHLPMIEEPGRFQLALNRVSASAQQA